MSDDADQRLSIVVEDGEAGRVDKLLAARFPGTSRSRLKRLFEGGEVRIDGRKAKKGDRAPVGATISLPAAPPDDDAMRPVPQPELTLDIAHADDAFIVINKAAGWPSHPLRAGERGSAANAIVAQFPECATVSDDPREGGLVNRLDAGTTGALVAARTRGAWLALRDAFSRGAVTKEYLAAVASPSASDGACDEPLAHDRERGGVRLARDRDFDAMEARTRWTVARQLAERALLRCTARTGRMHQIRIHLAHVGMPIVGDERYGGSPWPLAGHFLHGASVELPDPQTGAPRRIDVPLPGDRAAYLNRADES